MVPVSVHYEPALARAVAGRLVRSGDPGHATDGLRLLGTVSVQEDAGDIEAFLSDADVAVRSAAAGALLRSGRGASALADLIGDAARSAVPDQRVFAARAIAEAGRAPSLDALEELLIDPDAKVRREADAAVAALQDDQRIALLERQRGRRLAVRVIRACRSNASPQFCAYIAAQLVESREHGREFVHLLGAAGWRVAEADRVTFDRLIDREADRIAIAVKWLDALATLDPAIAPSVLRLRRALAQEATLAGRHMIDLLGLIYDRQLMARIGRVLDGMSIGDAGISIESLDLVLAPHHRATVRRALQSAFRRDDADRSVTVRVGSRVPAALEDLARDCRWAVHPDWLLACVLDLIRDAGVQNPTSLGVVALGPISAEVLGLREATARGIPDLG